MLPPIPLDLPLEGFIWGEPSNPCQHGKTDIKPMMMMMRIMMMMMMMMTCFAGVTSVTLGQGLNWPRS